MLLGAAISRVDIGNYVGSLFYVYGAMILVYVLLMMLLGFGVRPPYTRWFDAMMDFLREVCDPWLRLFRRLLPSFGGIDLSPMVAIICLGFLGGIVTNLIGG